MSWRRHLSRLRALLFQPDPAEELDQEIRAHLEFEEEENRASGMSQDEARCAARRAFGNVAIAKEESRDQWLYRRFDDFLQDVRYGLRTLVKAPDFAVVVVLTLALAIGANAAIFSFADLIIRRPVALPKLDRLVAISEFVPATEQQGISFANYRDLEAVSRSFTSLTAYEFWSATYTRSGEPEEVGGVRVSTNFFATLGLKPALGRTFLAEEAEPGRNHVLLISDSLWWRQFGRDMAVVGKSIVLNQQPYTVVGVMPPKSTFPLGAPLFWTPLPDSPQEKSERVDLVLNAIGLLEPAATVEQARGEIETIWAQLKEQYPEANTGRSVRVVHLLDQIVLDYNRQFTLLLLGVVGFVLLIACANVANLQLARAAGRQREIAVRLSLGAGRIRIFAQLVTESVLLAAFGGLLGLLLAHWGVHALRATLPSEVQEFCDLSDLRVDSASLVFTLSVTLLAGLLSGIFPAWQSSRADLNIGLKDGDGRVVGGRGGRLRRLLAIGEVALALVLLIGAGLMVKGFAALLSANPSLSPDSLLCLHINLSESRYVHPYQAKAFSDQLLARLQALPGVESAALATGVPYSFYDDAVVVRIDGLAAVQLVHLPTVMPESVSPAYFHVMHIALREGREFEASDDTGAAPVAIVSESMAKRFWSGENPIGKKLTLGTPNTAAIAVVGVVGDIPHEVYDRSFRSILYRPYMQAPPRSMDFVLRTTTNAAQFLATARSQVQKLDANLAIEHIETMTQKIANQTNSLRYVARLMAIFGGIALILSVVGVYGLMAYSVIERRREIGIRMALGAQSGNVLALVLRSGFSLTVSGLVLGILLSLALARLLANLIYGVSSWDVAAFTGVPALLAAVALIANYVPALRATRVDPTAVLRQQ